MAATCAPQLTSRSLRAWASWLVLCYVVPLRTSLGPSRSFCSLATRLRVTGSRPVSSRRLSGKERSSHPTARPSLLDAELDEFDELSLEEQLEQHFESMNELVQEDKARDSFDTWTQVETSATHGTIRQFATPIYRAPLFQDAGKATLLNSEIVKDTLGLRERDASGQTWSAEYYTGGYSSFGSEKQVHLVVDSLNQFTKLLEPHITAFASQLLPGHHLNTGELAMTECWVNMMGNGTTHDFHIHDSALISGTYYVRTPPGCSSICFEDPRVDLMAATGKRMLIEYPVLAGEVILFPGWLRHKVPPNAGEVERIGLSFNFARL
eukprot:TRINITY_DN49207_c0_g1_i1.p1 TRINITY_DN49207_c0_g1~~TRINITY_DN49207_c0_g1_i1.p1  ORF type:complete len:323 (+),score=42.89 TRINITY_DN49207_c0_g1_i1:11-979(+)